jgi:hypothetical protein
MRPKIRQHINKNTEQQISLKIEHQKIKHQIKPKMEQQINWARMHKNS